MKNINTFLFVIVQRGGGGGASGEEELGWGWRGGGAHGAGSVKEMRTLSQPSSSVIRRHDKVAVRKTLQGWHNPKTD